jgi:hypothetical protein
VRRGRTGYFAPRGEADPVRSALSVGDIGKYAGNAPLGSAIGITHGRRPLRGEVCLEERLPGVEKGGSIVLHETSAPSVLLGLRKDDVGRITVRHKGEDVVAEVNEFGYLHVERIVREAFGRIRAACVDLLRQHFGENPEQVMDPAFYGPMVRGRFMNRGDE